MDKDLQAFKRHVESSRPAEGNRAAIGIDAEGQSLERVAACRHHHDLMTGAMTYVTDGEGGVFGEGVLRFDEIVVSTLRDKSDDATFNTN